MISMPYDFAHLPLQTLLRPISDATTALARLDERIARSAVGAGWIERMHFADACASLWIDGELVHLEDLVLHEAGHDIRTPTHELTIAHDVLRTRRRIAAQPAGWALGLEGLRSLRGRAAGGTNAGNADGASGGPPAAALPEAAGGGEGHTAEMNDPLAAELAAIDAVLARSEATLHRASAPDRQTARQFDPLIHDPDWDENARLEEWRTVLPQLEGLPPVLQTTLALDAWNSLEVLQHASWLGRLLAASILRQAGLSTAAHLAAFNLGLKTIPVERRRHRDRDTRLAALIHGLAAAAEFGLKEHDRLTLARQMLERRLIGRRASSKLPDLIDLVVACPLVSTGMIAKTLGVTPRAALRIVEELNLRELTGRGRFRAWGVL